LELTDIMKGIALQLTLTTLLLGLSITARAAAPIVTNVVASQRSGTKLIDIHYDVLDADGDLLKIRLEISQNGGTNYSVPANAISGDFGNNIAPGTNKLIVWNAGVDWDGEYSPLMRVKIIASDSHGFPNLLWGQEVPPGGFLLGQDGGPEGIGPAKHVNIPYSYWLSKYEITVAQYAEYLNTALVAGELSRVGNDIRANAGLENLGIPANTSLYTLGGDIQWNLNKLEVLQGRTNLPVTVGWAGAIAFAYHYGYDLPTDAEWEKAARGPDHDGLGEHQIYPWGNTISGNNANFYSSGDIYENAATPRTPVGYYNGTQSPFGPDMANAYGLYDMIGNVAEWTRTLGVTPDNYPSTESPANAIHSLTASGARFLRGGSSADQSFQESLKCYGHGGAYQGFRVTRRSL
jgi:formylglycine-generating enzyme required for sulfatase activity